MTRIPLNEAARKLSELSELAFNGEVFELTKNGSAVALLGPPSRAKAQSARELASRVANWPKMSPAEAAAFASDVEAAIHEGKRTSPDLEWPS